LLLTGLALAGPRAAGAADPALEANPDSALALALERIAGAPLSLGEATEAALARATALTEAREGVRAARGAVSRERGAFDPEIFGQAERTGEETPSASPFSGAEVLETENTNVEAGARVLLPLGTEIAASLGTTRSETNSAFASLDPQIDAAGRLSLRQPLLAGFAPSASAPLTAAKRELEAARAQEADAELGVRGRVETTYWDLYAAERDYAVQILIRDRAKAFMDETDMRGRAGLVGPGAVANARVFLAEQEQAVLDREEELDRTSDRLASLMGTRPPGGQVRFRPIDIPPSDFPLVDQEELVAEARRNNHVIEAARRLAASQSVRARGAGWDALPELDLLGSLGGNGLSGTGQDVIFGGDTLKTSIDGGFGDAWRQVREREFPTWSVGLRLAVPLGLRGGRGEHARLRAETARAEAQVVALERALEEQVRATHRELANGSLRLQVAREGVAAAFEQVRIGLIEYRSGRSTAFELVRLGADLATAQQRYSQAMVRTAKAAAGLRQLTGGSYPDAFATSEGEGKRP
jgi:outer membrane protein TolC